MKNALDVDEKYMIKVHKVVVMVIDHDGLGAASVKEQLENARYPNRCISPIAMDVETREVEWSDNHVLNNLRRREWEFHQMFGAT